MRISGWLRLWIMAAFLSLYIVAIFTWIMWPQIEKTTHNPDFLTQVKPQSALLKCAFTTYTKRCENLAVLIVEMPNGHRLLLSVLESNPNAQIAANSYWQAVELEYKSVINKHLFYSGMLWISSSLVVLVLGMGVAWVNRGFRARP